MNVTDVVFKNEALLLKCVSRLRKKKKKKEKKVGKAFGAGKRGQKVGQGVKKVGGYRENSFSK